MNDVLRPAARPAHLGWRVLALVYDFFPALALWIATSGGLLLARGGEPIEPGSIGAWAELALLWAVTGAYAVASWRRGGQTLGMRAWRLRVVTPTGHSAPVGRLALRYAVATLSLLAAGLGFLWAFFDRDRRTWHDLAAGTTFVRDER